MSKKVLITQSNYIPWKGYFDSILQSDVFVVYDDMQYTKRDWRNRNLIKTRDGLKWLSIPVEVKNKFTQKINETKISEKTWNKSHLECLKQTYKNANSFKEVIGFVEEMYLTCNHNYLTEINIHFIDKINLFLGISTEIKYSSNFTLHEEKTQRLVDICLDLEASDYYTGPSAKNYMDEIKFKEKKINVHYFEYLGYPEYEQLNGAFVHGVSVLDLIFNVGSNAQLYMKNFR